MQKEILKLLSNCKFTYEIGWNYVLEVDNKCKLHNHSTIEIVYHKKGTGVVTMKNKTEQFFIPGSIEIYPPNLFHTQTMHKKGDEICIHIGVDKKISSIWDFPMYFSNISDTFIRNDLIELSKFQKIDTPFQQLILDSKVTTLILIFINRFFKEKHNLKSKKQTSIYTEKAHKYILYNYNKIKSLSEVGKKVGISNDYLRHLFKSEYNISMKEFLISTRIEKSKSLLQYSTLPLKIIADMIGFENDRYFCTCFKKIENKTPITFKNEKNYR